ncbi:RNA polymerase II associated protein 2 [Lunasporangiospora selenospora]|uniref:RNA polymerase II subunit B1 CTD phosphatase RPAP2 homolog n=1 Tax=Lunasporangiospora selenospora TaxID=979761 RepID=A0A9P6FN75_9FUNG|nr:RNA polymerase II associated protein 2 [Lunasporangiospora selenospora]
MKDDIVVHKSSLVEQYLPPPPSASENSAASSSSPASGSMDSGPKGEDTPALNKKQQLIQQNMEVRRQFEKMVLEWQEILCDPVSEQVLGEAANRIKQSHYREVIEERNIGKLCGYPLCPQPPRTLPPTTRVTDSPQMLTSTRSDEFQQDIKGTYRISLQERKVYDISVLRQYCSSVCLAASRWFDSQLTEEPIYLMNNDSEHLKQTRVRIVPLGMELSEFRKLKTGYEVATGSNRAPTFSPPNEQASVNSKEREQTSNQDDDLRGDFVKSLLASVPATPSHIKIVEHDTSKVIPREPQDSDDLDVEMDEVMEKSDEDDDDDDDDDDDEDNEDHSDHKVGAKEYRHDVVEGFHVPVRSKNRTGGKSRIKLDESQDSRLIESKFAKDSLSESTAQQEQRECHPSSMSMDTTP